MLLTLEADPEAVRQAMNTKPEHCRVVIALSPMPPLLETLASEIKVADREWLDAMR